MMSSHSKKLTKANSRFVAVPIVVRRFKKVDPVSAQEYNLNKLELKYLLRDYSTDIGVNKMRRINNQRQRLARHFSELWRKVRSLPLVEPGKSYACVAAVNATSDGAIIVPTKPNIKPKSDPGLISRYEARRDYHIAYSKFSARQEAARSLILSIAQRYARTKWVMEESVSLVARQELRKQRAILAKERRMLKRSREVREFPFQCYWPQYEKEQETISAPEETSVVFNTHRSPKSVKNKWVGPRWETECGLRNQKAPKAKDTSCRLSDERVRFLLFRLRLIIRSFRQRAECLRWVDRVLSDYATRTSSVEPQMETEGEILNVDKIVDQTGNIAIIESDKPSLGVSAIKTKGFSSYAVSREPQTFNTLTTRWMDMGVYQWKQSDRVNSTLTPSDNSRDLILPYQILKSHSNSPNAQILLSHRFFRTGLRIKCVMNSSPWQVGALVGAWTYGMVEDTMTIRNVYSALQRNHAILQAGSSNSIELVVPYHSFNSFMSNWSRECIMGYFNLFVLVPLTCNDSVAKTATVTVFVALEDVEAHGIISRNLGMEGILEPGIQGQMETIGALCNTGSNLLTTIGGFVNRDNPPLPLQPGSFIPQTMPSFSFTDGVPEPINVLRAVSSGQRVNPCPSREMSLIGLAQKWGLLTTFQWAFRDRTDTKLFTTDVTPLLEVRSYPLGSSPAAGIRSAYYPPVAMAASMAGRFRGSIEYKFVFVMNSFYTGTLAFTVVPQTRRPEQQSLAVLLRSYSQVVDVKKTTEVVISAPWNWYNAWAKTRGAKQKGDTISNLVVTVVNPLIAIENVPTEITCLVYVRAGSDFELATMRTPELAIGDGSMIIPPSTEYLTMYNTESAWYIDTNHRAKIGDNYMRVPYIQSVSDGFVGVIYIADKKLYKLADRTLKGLEYRLYADLEMKQRLEYLTAFPGFATANAMGFVMFTSRKSAEEFITAWEGNKLADYAKTHKTEFWSKNGPWAVVKRGDKWIPAENTSDDHPVIIDANLGVEPQMDDSGNVVQIEQAPPVTQLGLAIYGESMPDIKGIARRWQHFSSIKGMTCNMPYPRDCGYFCKFPVVPTRQLELRTSASYDNRVRDGSIAVLNSGFYLQDGSMRYRFIPVKAIPADTTLYIQHKFDVIMVKKGIVVGGKPRSYVDLLDTHYSTYAQALSVNPVVSVEVPYYRETERLLTTSVSHPSSNGTLYVWAHSSQAADLQLEVYYSVGDDFQWSVFQGFPSMVSLQELADEPEAKLEDDLEIIEPQMDTEGEETDDDEIWYSNRPSLQPYFPENRVDEPPKGQMFGAINNALDAVTSKVVNRVVDQRKDAFDSAIEETRNAAVSIRDNTPKITASLQQTTDKISSFIDKIVDLPASLSTVSSGRAPGSIITDLSHSAFDYVTHLMYCAMNPNARTVAWAVVNIYRNVWGFTLLGGEKLINGISGLWTRVTQASEQPQPEGQMEDTDIASTCSVIYASLCQMLKIALDPPRTWSDVGRGLFKFPDTLKGGSLVAAFVKDNIELFKRVWRTILNWFGLSSKNHKLISGIKDTRLKSWCVQATAILNPAVRQKLFTNTLWAEKAFELGVVGRGIALALSDDKLATPKLTKFVQDLLSGIRKIEEELVNRRIFCGERYEPFCLWACGGAGVGKTRLLQEVATELADLVHSTSPQTYHTLTFNQQYFDGYVGQPSVFIDDFLALSPVTDPTATMFLQMKSSALFNPPYSAVEDKSKLINFYNLLITSNFAGVFNTAGIHDETAYNRRRDLVIEVSKRVPSKSQYTLEDYAKLEHVTVSYYPDPLTVNVNSSIPIKRDPSKNYFDTVMEFILERAKNYHATEAKSYAERCRKKIARLDKYSTVDSIDDYLKNAKELFEGEQKASMDNLFNMWLKPMGFDPLDEGKKIGDKLVSEGDPAKKKDIDVFLDAVETPDQIPNEVCPAVIPSLVVVPSTSKKIEPQGSDEGVAIAEVMKQTSFARGLEWSANYWPWNRLEGTYDPRDENSFGEPLPRDEKPAYLHTNDFCIHYSVKNMVDYIYSPDTRCFEKLLDDNPFCQQVTVPNSFSPAVCCLRNNDEIVPNPKCMMTRKAGLVFRLNAVKGWLQENSVRMTSWPKIDLETVKDFPVEWVKEAIKVNEEIMDQFTIMTTPSTKRAEKFVEQCQKTVADNHEVIDGVLVPKASRWKTVPIKIWCYFLAVMRLIWKALEKLAYVVSVFSVAFMAGSLCYNKCFPAGQLHPSGDHKTIRAQKTSRNQALQLAKPIGNMVVDGELTVDVMEKVCSEGFSNSSVDGRFRNIVRNVFTLVGIAPLEGSKKMIYRVRCIGLNLYRFLVLKHYIEHFESVGVQQVAICYHKSAGFQTFSLNDLNFEWTEAGYGVGHFPTLARPFKNIVNYIPSEALGDNYPREMYMVEVNIDNVKIHQLDVIQMQHSQVVPSKGAQTAWTIDKGFSYNWGGSGRCCSFLFAPGLASPFVGIHTAGIGERKGFSERLYKETFISSDSHLDFVIPNMEINPEGRDLEGPGFTLGHLEKNKSVNIPNKSRIVPSEIHGVFSVCTAPAPLSRFDVNIQGAFDPLDEGVKKRCNPPLEFSIHDLNEAKRDLSFKLNSVVKPLRLMRPLTVVQSVEGLPIRGYEPLELSTSEGYPWVLDRPSNASGKSWMFEMMDDPSGRRKLVRIYNKLHQTLEIKNQMRERGIVPYTPYSVCLKDARISLEKLAVPGKTRVFEMSPVDLTIAQRQYYLDFYAAYQSARLKAENSIGINPDGPEWTELVNYLISFSDKILTADYSGYGPQLSMTVQKYAYDMENEWYTHWETKDGIPEVERDRNGKIRATMKYEMLHPPTVVKDTVFMFATGMPSGNAGTVIKNSECNSIYIRVIYLSLARHHMKQYADLFFFDKFVRMVSNGDDLIIAVKDEIIDWFNNKTLIDEFAKYNIKMTDALKQGNVRPYCSIYEATFLKRGFKPHPYREGHWLAPLEEQSVTDTANWIWASIDSREASLVNSEMACRLAYSLGPDKYYDIAEHIQRAWRDRDVQFKFPKWSSLDAHVWDLEEGPIFSFI